MDISFSQFSRLAVAALIASVGALAQAEDTGIKPMNKVEAQAACDTLIEKINTYRGAGDLANAKRTADFCDETVTTAYEKIRMAGSEYFVFGVGASVGGEVNTPALKRVSAGMRIAFGGSMFVTDNSELRFTPMFNLVPLAVQGIIKGSPSPFEPQVGIIVYIGSRNTKSISQLSGIYGGAGGEGPNVFSSEQQGRSSLAINFLRNVRGNWVVVGLKSFNAGSNMVAGNVQIMSVNNITRTGGGSHFTEMFKGVGGELLDIVTSASDALLNAVKSPFTK